MSTFKSIAKLAPVVVTAGFTAGELADKQVFTANRPYELLEVIEVHRVAGAASATIMIEKTASGVAPGSGVDLLGTAFAIDSTADTPVRKHVANGGLVSSAASRTLNAGDSLSVDATGTLTAYEGVLTLVLKPLTTGSDPY
jgi:hypothetical protein